MNCTGRKGQVIAMTGDNAAPTTSGYTILSETLQGDVPDITNSHR